MKIQFPTELAKQLNQEALDVFELLAPKPEKLEAANGIYRPHIPIWLLNLRSKEVPFARVAPVIDIDGKEMARFFFDCDPSIGFASDGHTKFLNFCQRIQQLEDVESKVSFTFVVETVFNWMEEKYSKSTSQTLCEYFLAICNPEIVNQEVWTPVFGIKLNVEINFGDILFKSVTENNWRKWITELNSRKPEAINNLRKFFEKTEDKCPAVAITKMVAEPIRAIEKSSEKVESALSILRFFSPANFNPSMHTYCTVYGREFIERPRHLFVKNGLLTLASVTDSNLRWRHPWSIDASLLTKMKEKGFDILVKLHNQKAETRTEFQNALLSSLRIYSKSSLAQNLSDKLLYIVVALENLLLKNSSEPLQKNISDRMALLIGRSLEERLDIIRTYKKAYRLRSEAVHHGADLSETPDLKNFMKYAWWTFNKLVEKSDFFITREEMINYIDDIKFA